MYLEFSLKITPVKIYRGVFVVKLRTLTTAINMSNHDRGTSTFPLADLLDATLLIWELRRAMGSNTELLKLLEYYYDCLEIHKLTVDNLRQIK